MSVPFPRSLLSAFAAEKEDEGSGTGWRWTKQSNTGVMFCCQDEPRMHVRRLSFRSPLQEERLGEQ
jgi:hypothetical protein